jgi:hypothetical protein
MTDKPAVRPIDEIAIQALSDAGAICGDCGSEPGDRVCPDCERCRGWYVAALRAAGWAPGNEELTVEVNRLRAELAQERQNYQAYRIGAEGAKAIAAKRITDLDRALGETIDDRDRLHEIADKLAYAVAPIEVIGEHSSMNCPWTNAYELITSKAEVDRLRAQTSNGAAIEQLERAIAAEVVDDRALSMLDALIVLRSQLPCTCARSRGLHEKTCRRYVPGHELLSPARRLARARTELAAHAATAPAAVETGE